VRAEIGFWGWDMTLQQRWIMLGALIGLAGGAVSVAALRFAPGSAAGTLASLLPGALAGGFTAALASGWVLRKAAAHLASLAEDEAQGDLVAIGHNGFDAAQEKLHELLDRARVLRN